MRILQVIPSPFAQNREKRQIYITVLYKMFNKRGARCNDYHHRFWVQRRLCQSLRNVRNGAFRQVANLGRFLYSTDMKAWLKSNVSDYDIVHLHRFRSYQNNLASNMQRSLIFHVLSNHMDRYTRIVQEKGLESDSVTLPRETKSFKMLKESSR